jgi:hypothetical protein
MVGRYRLLLLILVVVQFRPQMALGSDVESVERLLDGSPVCGGVNASRPCTRKENDVSSTQPASGPARAPLGGSHHVGRRAQKPWPPAPGGRPDRKETRAALKAIDRTRPRTRGRIS